MKYIDLTGMKYGRWTVIERVEDYISPKGRHEAKWLCKCECGNIDTIRTSSLRSGKSKSCGCLKKELRILHNRKYNEYEINYDKKYVLCSTSKGNKFYIDLEDLELIKPYYWEITCHGYVRSICDKQEILLHRLITNCPDNMVVDHINHNTLDNRKCNLRIVTQTQNLMNRCVKGVSWNSTVKKWEVEIRKNHKRIRLGKFNSYEEAVSVRKQAEKQIFGEFSYDNSMKVGKQNAI